MAIVNDLLEFLKGCPYLANFQNNPFPYVTVNSLGEYPDQYTIEPASTSEWVRKYTDGGGQKQYLFVFASRFFHGSDIVTNVRNLAFFEKFSEWLEGIRPEIPNWIRVEPLTGGYLYQPDEGQDTARYQIQCRVLYEHEGVIQ